MDSVHRTRTACMPAERTNRHSRLSRKTRRAQRRAGGRARARARRRRRPEYAAGGAACDPAGGPTDCAPAPCRTAVRRRAAWRRSTQTARIEARCRSLVRQPAASSRGAQLGCRCSPARALTGRPFLAPRCRCVREASSAHILRFTAHCTTASPRPLRNVPSAAFSRRPRTTTALRRAAGLPCRRRAAGRRGRGTADPVAAIDTPYAIATQAEEPPRRAGAGMGLPPRTPFRTCRCTAARISRPTRCARANRRCGSGPPNTSSCAAPRRRCPGIRSGGFRRWCRRRVSAWR